MTARPARAAIRSMSRWAAVVAPAVLTVLAGCTTVAAPHSAGTAASSSGTPAPVPTRVCGHAILDSPYHYHGRPGTYASGKPGLPTYGTPRSDFPKATAGLVLPAGKHSYSSYQLAPDTVYYLLPGTHIGSFQANKNDAFVGGHWRGRPAVLSGEYSGYPWAIDSNYSSGNQPGVTIEYLTIEKFQPDGDAAAINQSSNTNWILQYNTITLNAPGAGAIAATNNVLKHNCMTRNGQYGFQSVAAAPWGNDSLTGGPYNLTIADNEISYNDTCDFEGLLTNRAIGWSKHNPVPVQDRNSHCGKVVGDGNEGGFKLWRTDGVTIRHNYIHHNWGPGIWTDTDNANTTYSGNTITDNDGEAITEEISYNFSIIGNYLANNGWAEGLSNPGFPTPAIYISQSGSDLTSGGVPACPESSCSRQGSYPRQSVISGNVLVNNGANILLWQDSDRFCSAGFDSVCTLVGGGSSGPFTIPSCKANLRSSSIDTTTFVARRTGSPAEDWWNGCLWHTTNVKIAANIIDFDPAAILHCNRADWPACGADGMFAQYGIAHPYNQPGGWVIPNQLTFFQGNRWSDNVYNGPSTFYAWNQGNASNPVSWDDWTGRVSKGDKCSSAGAHTSGACTGPFGQDSGSRYHQAPLPSPPAPGPALAP